MSGHISPKTTSYTIFGSLMVLTAITVTMAFTNLGLLNFPVALGIAIVKATLVVLFFMHVKYSSQLTKLVVGSAFFFLVILSGLTMSDYLIVVEDIQGLDASEDIQARLATERLDYLRSVSTPGRASS